MFAEALRQEGYSAYRERLFALLGIPGDVSGPQIHDLIVEGFPPTRLVALCEREKIPSRECDWVIPPRMLKTRLSKDERLTVGESDRLFRVMHAIALAETLFGESERAVRWLRKPKKRFGGQTPLAMLATTPGMCAVEEMILQVAEGYAL